MGFDGFLAWVVQLREQVGIPGNLAAIGIGLEDSQLVGQMAVVDPTAATNPILFTATEYSALFERAVSGRLGKN